MVKNTAQEQQKIIGELLVILALPSALPVATGGIAHAMSVPIIILATYGLLFGKANVSGKKSRIVAARDKVLSFQKLREFHDKLWHHAGKLSRERWGWLFDTMAFRAITALFIVVCAVCFWTIIPVADTPPSIAVMLFGFSIVYRDILVWLLAVVVGIIGVVINIGTLSFLLTKLFEWLQGLF
jgi:hypothetical protein